MAWTLQTIYYSSPPTNLRDPKNWFWRPGRRPSRLKSLFTHLLFRPTVGIILSGARALNVNFVKCTDSYLYINTRCISFLRDSQIHAFYTLQQRLPSMKWWVNYIPSFLHCPIPILWHNTLLFAWSIELIRSKECTSPTSKLRADAIGRCSRRLISPSSEACCSINFLLSNLFIFEMISFFGESNLPTVSH